jgi:hypothetical protein
VAVDGHVGGDGLGQGVVGDRVAWDELSRGERREDRVAGDGAAELDGFQQAPCVAAGSQVIGVDERGDAWIPAGQL